MVYQGKVAARGDAVSLPMYGFAEEYLHHQGIHISIRLLSIVSLHRCPANTQYSIRQSSSFLPRLLPRFQDFR